MFEELIVSELLEPSFKLLYVFIHPRRLNVVTTRELRFAGNLLIRLWSCKTCLRSFGAGDLFRW